MKKIIALFLVILMLAALMTGCKDVMTEDDGVPVISYEDAVAELDALLTGVKVTEAKPIIDIDVKEDVSEADSLASISTFPLVVKGSGQINIEIAADTEMSTPRDEENPNDDWMIVLAEQFNKENHEYNGKKVTVSVREITGGETVTYMRAAGYRPDLFVPSHAGLGKMIDASGIRTITLCDRLLGNTAGILMSKEVYNTFIEKYKEVTVKNVVEANLAGDLLFAYTNPYSSSTGLNLLTMILYSFDPDNPLSQTAAQKLYDYQRTSPPTAYTTAIMKNKAAKGIVTAMAMEEQAYILTPSLSDYVFTPAGIRHDHPVITFDYVSQEKQEAAKLFIDYCLSDEAQKLGTQKGFNRHDDYKGQDPGLDGAGYLQAQKLWKQNKEGGRPVVAVFVADVSGSMRGTRLESLQKSLLNTLPYIKEENYCGLISYSNDVCINVPIDNFTPLQRAKFSGAIKSLSPLNQTATYDAVLEGMRLLLDKQKELPDARLMLILLTDGEQNRGIKYDRIRSIVKALQIPVYTIGYDMKESEKEVQNLKDLAEKINEARVITATPEDVINELRALFNSQL